jgi:hypothetical protein
MAPGTLHSVLLLLADTCVWLDLSKNVNGEVLIATVRTLISQGKMELLVPQVVIDEFQRNRERVETDMGRSVSSTFRQVREAVHQHGQDVGRDAALRQLDDLTHRLPLINQMATRHFDEILDLLQAGQRLGPSPAVDRRVVQRGLDKKAPFHRSKNSVADATLIEIYGETVVAHVGGADAFCFVTTNTKDFSRAAGDTRLPHEDLAAFFDTTRSRFFTNLALAITTYFPDVSEDLSAELEYHEEPRNLSEIAPLLDKLWDQIWYNRHKNLEYQIESGEVELVDEYEPDAYQRTVVRSVWEGAQAAAQRVEQQYGPDDLGPWDDFDWGMISGKMSALRWMLGEDWDSTLDT